MIVPCREPYPKIGEVRDTYLFKGLDGFQSDLAQPMLYLKESSFEDFKRYWSEAAPKALEQMLSFGNPGPDVKFYEVSTD